MITERESWCVFDTSTHTHTHRERERERERETKRQRDIHPPTLTRLIQKMPCESKYQVESRYTNRKALLKKLKEMFPTTKEAAFDVKVSRQ